MAITISITSGTGYFGSIYTQTGAAGAGQWYADEDPIAGQTGNTYTMEAKNEGKAISFRTASPDEKSNPIRVFVPSMIPGLVAQFDAARNDLMTFNSNKVASWASSVGALVLNQTTDANRPLWSATGRNSKPAVSGNGTSLFMTLNTPSALPQGANASCMAAMAYHPNANSGAWTGVFVYGTSTVTTARQISKQDSTNRAGISLGSAGSHTFPAGATWLDADKIVVGNFNPTNLDARIDGQYTGASAAITLNTPVPTIAQLFRFTNNSGYWPGSVQELLFYSAALSLDDRKRLEGYMASKWGTRALLPAGHEYKSTNPPTGPAVTVDAAGYLPTAAISGGVGVNANVEATGLLPTAEALIDAVGSEPITISVTSGTGYAGSVYTRDQGNLGQWYAGGQPLVGETGLTLTMKAEWEGKTIQFRALNGLRSNRIDLFTPADVPGLLCWFDAAAEATITKDGSGLVSMWASRWGSWNATQAVGGSQPTHSMTGRSGKPAVIADGAGDHLVINPVGPGLPVNDDYHTVMGVAYYANHAPGAYRMLFKWGAPSARRGIAKDNLEKVGIIGGSGATNSSSNEIWTNKDAIVIGGYEYFGSQLNVNGEADWIKVATYDNVVAQDAYIFRDATVYWNGSAQDILIFSRRITDVERQKLEGYAAAKWGLRGLLPAGHPYKSTNPPPPTVAVPGEGYLPTADIVAEMPMAVTAELAGYLPTAAISVASPSEFEGDLNGYLPTAEIAGGMRTVATIETDGLLPFMEGEFRIQTRATLEFNGYLPTAEIMSEFPVRATLDLTGYLPVAEIGGEAVYVVDIEAMGFLPTAEIDAPVFQFEITADVQGYLPTAEGSMALSPEAEIAAEGYLPFTQGMIQFPTRITAEMEGYLPVALIGVGLNLELEIDLNGLLPFAEIAAEPFAYVATADVTGYLPVAEIGGEAVYEVDIEALGLLPTMEGLIDIPQTNEATIVGMGLLPVIEIEAKSRNVATLSATGYLATMEATYTVGAVEVTLDLVGYLPIGSGASSARPGAIAPSASTANSSLTVGGGPVLRYGSGLKVG